MRASVQLGLLCLSLLISSLGGEEMDLSMQFQVADNEQDSNLLSHDSDIIPVNFHVEENNGKKLRKKKLERPGSLVALLLPTTRVKRLTDTTGSQLQNTRTGIYSQLGKPSKGKVSSGKILAA